MRRRAKSFLMIGLFCSVVLLAQSGYAEVGKVEFRSKISHGTLVFTSRADQIVVKFKGQVDLADVGMIIDRYSLKPSVKSVVRVLESSRIGIVALAETSDVDSVRAWLDNENDVAGVLPVYVDQEGYQRYIDPEWFLVQFHRHIDESDALKIIAGWGCDIVHDYWTPGFYRLATPDGMSVFEAVEEFMKWPEVRFTEPLFYGIDNLDQGDEWLDDQWQWCCRCDAV